MIAGKRCQQSKSFHFIWLEEKEEIILRSPNQGRSFFILSPIVMSFSFLQLIAFDELAHILELNPAFEKLLRHSDLVPVDSDEEL